MESTNPFADQPVRGAGPRLESAASPLNPYAAPAGAEESFLERGPGVGLWRHGDLVVIHESLDFPERCIWTNETGGERRSTTLAYPIWLGLSQGKIKFKYSLSAESQQRQLRNETWSLGILGVGAALLLVTVLQVDGRFHTSLFSLVISACGLLGIVAISSGWYLFRQNSRPLWIMHRDGPYFVLGGVGAPFVRSLPRWPGLLVRSEPTVPVK